MVYVIFYKFFFVQRRRNPWRYLKCLGQSPTPTGKNPKSMFLVQNFDTFFRMTSKFCPALRIQIASIAIKICYYSLFSLVTLFPRNIFAAKFVSRPTVAGPSAFSLKNYSRCVSPAVLVDAASFHPPFLDTEKTYVLTCPTFSCNTTSIRHVMLSQYGRRMLPELSYVVSSYVGWNVSFRVP